jgi:hypothetical protein
MTRVLFLDLDGVLHPIGVEPGASLPFEWLPELAALLSTAPDVAVAVHSSWGERYSVSELTEFLGDAQVGRSAAIVNKMPSPQVRKAFRTASTNPVTELHLWVLAGTARFSKWATCAHAVANAPVRLQSVDNVRA